jgi:hypothetical protein
MPYGNDPYGYGGVPYGYSPYAYGGMGYSVPVPQFNVSNQVRIPVGPLQGTPVPVGPIQGVPVPVGIPPVPTGPGQVPVEQEVIVGSGQPKPS